MTTTKIERIFLSPPHMGGEEMRFVKAAFESNYIAPLGPRVNAFEREFAEYIGIKHCAAVSSGTAAMHLGLRHLGVGPGDEVFASTLTFIGSVTPVVCDSAESLGGKYLAQRRKGAKKIRNRGRGIGDVAMKLRYSTFGVKGS